jgi:hypothetical protein
MKEKFPSNQNKSNKYIKLAKWCMDRSKYFTYGLMTLVLLMVLSMRALPILKKKNAKDYFLAKASFENWKNAKTNSDELKELLRITKKHMHLTPSFEASIAQELIANDKVEEAKYFASFSIKRLEKNLPLHAIFAKGSILIANDKYKEALKGALLLKKQIKENAKAKDYDLLYGYNLLRIAVLQKSLDKKSQELISWQEFEKYLKTQKNEPNLQILDQAHTFYEKESIQNYLDHRKKIISKS